MSIDLPRELEAIVQRELATGQYDSKEQVYARALRMLQHWRKFQLRRDVQIGLEQLDRGEGIRIEDDEGLRNFFDELMSEVNHELDSRSTASE